MRGLSFFPVVLAIPLVIGCGGDDGPAPAPPARAPPGCNGECCEGKTFVPDPRVARTVAEVWPQRQPAAPLTRETVVSMCARTVGCGVGHDLGFDVTSCVSGVLWSMERGIPVEFHPGFLSFTTNLRAEAAAVCIGSATSCDAVRACVLDGDAIDYRRDTFDCGEEGCRQPDWRIITCEGSRASVHEGCRRFVRDCARAGVACDPDAETVCGDRPRTLCPEGVSGAPRCEGDVRLGCNGDNYVTYHDCGRLEGGRCVTTGGVADCRYADTLDPGCGSERAVGKLACGGGKLTMCAYGKVVTVEAPELCPLAGWQRQTRR